MDCDGLQYCICFKVDCTVSYSGNDQRMSWVNLCKPQKLFEGFSFLVEINFGCVTCEMQLVCSLPYGCVSMTTQAHDHSDELSCLCNPPSAMCLQYQPIKQESCNMQRTIYVH